MPHTERRKEKLHSGLPDGPDELFVVDHKLDCSSVCSSAFVQSAVMCGT